MQQADYAVFSRLYNDAARLCFGVNAPLPMSETESRLFANKIFEATGLVIGWKSLKNYSIALARNDEENQNPSVATLDTLARYVAGAAFTDESGRKAESNDFRYWFNYRALVLRDFQPAPETHPSARLVPGFSEQSPVGPDEIPISKATRFGSVKWYLLILTLVLVAVFFASILKEGSAGARYHTSFKNASQLPAEGWFVQHVDTNYWNKRNQNPGELTLFTLEGDNWPDTQHRNTGITNLVMRRVTGDCFTIELSMHDFMPATRWQQAGMLLIEDSSSDSKSIRISLGYNDEFGGYVNSPEIIIQAVSSSGATNTRPEEIIHLSLYKMDSIDKNPLLRKNFEHSALRIEKSRDQFRFLYATGRVENSAFHEIGTFKLDLSPKFAALFAFKGYQAGAPVIPVRINAFTFQNIDCR